MSTKIQAKRLLAANKRAIFEQKNIFWPKFLNSLQAQERS